MYSNHGDCKPMDDEGDYISLCGNIKEDKKDASHPQIPSPMNTQAYPNPYPKNSVAPGFLKEAKGQAAPEECNIYTTLGAAEDGKKGPGCTKPPWWTWVIISIGILILLGLVIIIIFVAIPYFKAGTTTYAGMDTLQSTRNLQDATRAPERVETVCERDPQFFCVANTRFVSGISTSPILGVTLTDCKRRCIESPYLCFGAEYQKDSRTCTLLHYPYYRLDVIGKAQNYNNYRRRFIVKEPECRFDTHVSRKTVSLNGTVMSDVKTASACAEKCLNYQFVERPEQLKCYAANFHHATKTCYLIYKGGITKSEHGWTYFIMRENLTCYSSILPDQTYDLTLYKGKQIVPIQHSEDIFRESLQDCINDCVTRSGCLGIVKDRTGPRCAAQFGVSFRMQANETVNTYRILSSRGTACGDAVQRLSPADAGSETTSGNVEFRDCYIKCDRNHFPRHGERCFGFEYNFDNATCLINTNGQYNSDFKPGFIRYRLLQTCYNCGNKVLFIPTAGPLSVGLTSRVRVCAHGCKYPPYPQKTCYGFSVHSLTGMCTHFTNFLYEIGDIHQVLHVAHFRRRYNCPGVNPCEETYTRKPNQAVLTGVGIRQPWDINTPELCTDRCWGYAIVTDTICYGVDFNKRTSRCTVYLNDGYRLSPYQDVDHYVRDMKCDPSTF